MAQVQVQLVHPLRAPYALEVGLPFLDFPVGALVMIDADDVQELVAAGYAVIPGAGTPQPVDNTYLTASQQRAAFVPALPTAGSYTYNADGTIATDPDGNSYTWNADGTPKTQTKGGVTRTYSWNADGTLASVA